MSSTSTSFTPTTAETFSFTSAGICSADGQFGEVSLSELQAALDQSRGIITKVNMEENNTHLSQIIAQSKQVLTQAFDSDQFSSMSEDDKLTMASVIKTLTVIEQLNTKQADNSLASKYANVALY